MGMTDIGWMRRGGLTGVFGMVACLPLTAGCTNTLELGDSNDPVLEAETIQRWNLVADARPDDMYHFHWVKNQFPHPTFAAFGEAEGYREFSVVLDDFFSADDDFQFLDEHHLFQSRYYYVTEATSDQDLVVTWQGLADDFSTGVDRDTTPPDVQMSLSDFAQQMHANP